MKRLSLGEHREKQLRMPYRAVEYLAYGVQLPQIFEMGRKAQVIIEVYMMRQTILGLLVYDGAVTLAPALLSVSLVCQVLRHTLPTPR